MTEHYSHVGGAEKLAAVGQVVRMIPGLNGESGGGDGAATGPITKSNEPNLLNELRYPTGSRPKRAHLTRSWTWPASEKSSYTRSAR